MCSWSLYLRDYNCNQCKLCKTALFSIFESVGAYSVSVVLFWLVVFHYIKLSFKNNCFYNVSSPTLFGSLPSLIRSKMVLLILNLISKLLIKFLSLGVPRKLSKLLQPNEESMEVRCSNTAYCKSVYKVQCEQQGKKLGAVRNCFWEELPPTEF